MNFDQFFNKIQNKYSLKLSQKGDIRQRLKDGCFDLKDLDNIKLAEAIVSSWVNKQAVQKAAEKRASTVSTCPRCGTGLKQAALLEGVPALHCPKCHVTLAA